jgi:hypothetical protein
MLCLFFGTFPSWLQTLEDSVDQVPRVPFFRGAFVDQREDQLKLAAAASQAWHATVQHDV